jgi:hypothetical protein
MTKNDNTNQVQGMRCPFCNAIVHPKRLNDHKIKVCPKRPKTVILYSKRGKRVEATKSIPSCNYCFIKVNMLWQYESNLGTICLCDHCKAIIQAQSGRKADAMHKSVPGGAFGQNRRRR